MKHGAQEIKMKRQVEKSPQKKYVQLSKIRFLDNKFNKQHKNWKISTLLLLSLEEQDREIGSERAAAVAMANMALKPGRVESWQINRAGIKKEKNKRVF